MLRDREEKIMNNLRTIKLICKITIDTYNKKGLFLSSFEHDMKYIRQLTKEIKEFQKS